MLRRPDASPDDSPSVGRLVSFSDGVIAIAITLLAFQLRIPKIANTTSASELANAIGHDAHQYVVYGTSFAIIGQYWIVHHRAFHHMSGHDRMLAYVNLVFLFTISFLPFSSNLFGQYRDNRTAVVLYGASLAAVSLAYALVWFTALLRGFVDASTDPRLVRMMSWRAGLVPCILVGSTILALFTTRTIVELSWLTVLVMFVVLSIVFADVRGRY
ncbi:MAG TPA: TMEM175 family protein [Acidimicrobiales bacterium]|nr:TMEM175 family protein [Acidimicrobiales bacterium]